MTEKELYILNLPQLDKMPLQQVGDYLDANVEHEVIDCVNWPQEFPYKPYSTFVVAVSATRLYVYFSVICKDLRAQVTKDLGPVADDSCVEFFMMVPGNEEYWNFEFNCIGILNGSHRVVRPEPMRLTSEELSSIKRYSSCGSDAIEEQDGTFCWDLTISIPLNLLGLDAENLPDYIMGNFYKCAGKTTNKHYVTWNPIESEKPDFHRPDCFGKLWFRRKETETSNEQTTASAIEPKGFKKVLFKIFGK